MASWSEGTGDQGAAGKTAPALLCAPKTAEKDAEFATGETCPEILQLSTPSFYLCMGAKIMCRSYEDEAHIKPQDS